MIRNTFATTDLLFATPSSTNVVKSVFYFSDKGAAYTGGNEPHSLAAAAKTTICGTPAAGYRDIDHGGLCATGGANTITFGQTISGVDYPLGQAVLAVNEMLEYTHAQGWFVKDANGSIKNVNTAAQMTRSLWLLIDNMIIDAGMCSIMGTFTADNIMRCLALADGVTNGGYLPFVMPSDAQTNTVTVRPVWTPVSSDATPHTVRWQIIIKNVSNVDFTGTPTTIAWTGDSAARTMNVDVLETGQVSTGVNCAAGDRITLELARLGADGADTYVGTVDLCGIRIDYKAVS
jgi:hypothetical protein